MTLAEWIAKEKILKKDFAKLHGISDQTLSLWIKWDYIVKDGMIYKPKGKKGSSYKPDIVKDGFIYSPRMELVVKTIKGDKKKPKTTPKQIEIKRGYHFP